MVIKHVLVTGASHGYGCQITHMLRSYHHQVYTMQRAMIPTDFGSSVRREEFIHCDMGIPESCLGAVQEIRERDLNSFDVIIHAVAKRAVVEPDKVNCFNLSSHFLTNIFSPLMLTVYLQRYGFFKAGGRVIWLLDTNKWPEDHLCYKASKVALPSVVKSILPVLADIQLVFVQMPLQEKSDDDQITENFAKLVVKKNLDKEYYDFSGWVRK